MRINKASCLSQILMKIKKKRIRKILCLGEHAKIGHETNVVRVSTERIPLLFTRNKINWSVFSDLKRMCVSFSKNLH